MKENAHRKNDFSGANDFYDIWAIDEFTDDSEKYESEQGRNPNTLLVLLDGQEARLDAKYERRLIKKDNLPIVMIGNKLAHQVRKAESPLAKRVIPLRFQTQVSDLDSGRIAATLYRAMCLRAAYYYYAEVEKADPVLR